MSAVIEVGERRGLFAIASIALAIIGLICGAIVFQGKMPDGSEGLLGGALTGLILLARDVINTIRSLASDKQMGNMADKLSQSTPAGMAANDVGDMEVIAENVEVTGARGKPAR
jgi:hypothetical protein